MLRASANTERRDKLIPTNITQEHVLSVIAEIDIQGVPPKRLSRSWYLEYEGRSYPPKYVISKANVFANGYELVSTSSGGKLTIHRPSIKYLRSLGFTVEKQM